MIRRERERGVSSEQVKDLSEQEVLKRFGVQKRRERTAEEEQIHNKARLRRDFRMSQRVNTTLEYWGQWERKTMGITVAGKTGSEDAGELETRRGMFADCDGELRSFLWPPCSSLPGKTRTGIGLLRRRKRNRRHNLGAGRPRKDPRWRLNRSTSLCSFAAAPAGQERQSA